MNKLRALVVGSYPRYADRIRKILGDFLAFEHITCQDRFPSTLRGEFEVVVLLTRLGRKSIFEPAKDYARRNRLLVAECPTENHVRGKLEEMGLLKKETPVNENKAEPAAKLNTPNSTYVTSVSDETQIGISQSELIDKYMPKVVEAIETVLEAGERIHEDELVEVLSDLVGLPANDILFLLPEISATKGCIINTVGKTWKRPKRGEFSKEDKVEVPPPRKAVVRDGLLKKFTGLHPGPYKSMYAVSKELANYVDFYRQDGKPSSKSYHRYIVDLAKKAGLLEERDGHFYVKSDSSVVLTPVPEKTKPKEDLAGKQKPAPAQKDDEAIKIGDHVLGTSFVPLFSLRASGEKDAEKESKKSSDLRRYIEPITAPSILAGQLRKLKSLMPQHHWDEMALREIARRLERNGMTGRVLSKEHFNSEEWDSLAWERIKDLPLSAVVPVWFPYEFKDELLTCNECMKTFVFTKADQDLYFQRFGQVKAPKLCPRCRRLRKEGKLGTDEADDHVLGRHGGR